MQQDKQIVPMWPEQASSLAFDVDLFYAAMIGVSVFTTVLIAALILYFAIKYRRREGDYRPPHMETSKALEIIWTVIPLILVAGMFVWGAELFFRQTYIPENALNIEVTGKQWMFKFQHPNGRREINMLHVPLGTPVRLTLASEDVIHDLFIPDFRIKKDLVPGRYTSTWFEATKPGTYHLFCNQYCGTQHSDMIGSVIVMQPTEYQNWLAGFTGESPTQAGEALFTKHACNTCHSMDGSGGRGPSLVGLLGSKVQLATGGTVTADKTYIRDSILKPQDKIVAGYTPIMPSYQGLLTEEQVTQLIAYIDTLKGGPTGQQAAAHPGGGNPAGQSAHQPPTGGQAAATQAVAQPQSQTQPTRPASTPSAAPAPQATPTAEPAGTPTAASTTGSTAPAAPATTPQATPAATPGSTPQSTPAATPSPTPESTAAPATPAPSPASTPAPTPQATPAQPAPAPAPEATPASGSAPTTSTAPKEAQ